MKKVPLGEYDDNYSLKILINLCNGEITADCSISVYALMQISTKIGNNGFNFNYKIDKLINGNYLLGKNNSLALLEPYCNRPANPNSCCCQK